MIKKFDLSNEKEINAFLEDQDKDLTASVSIVGNAKPGECIIQVDRDTEKRSVIRSLINAHAQFFNDILTDNNKLRFAMGQEIMINGEIAKKLGGNQRRDELEEALRQCYAQMNEFRQKISVGTWHMKALTDNIRDVKEGKYDDQFVKAREEKKK